MEQIQEKTDDGTFQYFYRSDYWWETVVMKKYLEFDDSRGMFTDDGSFTMNEDFGDMFNLVHECIDEAIRELKSIIVKTTDHFIE